jgi:hypothetical protein
MFLGDESTIAGEQDKNADDPKFYQEITSGPIQRAATVRLLNRSEIDGLFSDAEELQVDYALRTVNNGKEKVQYWLVSAVFSKLLLIKNFLYMDLLELFGFEMMDLEAVSAISQMV